MAAAALHSLIYIYIHTSLEPTSVLGLPLNIISSFFIFVCVKKKRRKNEGKEKKKRDEDNFNFLLVGFWASAGKGRMNNHAEPKDKRAFFASLLVGRSGAGWWLMLAEGEVIFSCVRSKDGVEEEEVEVEEVSGRGQTSFFGGGRRRETERETFCVTHNNSRWKNLTTATA